ncbi:MAG: hypothetical protein IH586_13295 [Anaerolineaceae bacterium]|nr:hypothetical protein [Anaerolineaceae bacterium]
MNLAWKQNWDETRQHMDAWWNHRGFVVGAWGPPKSRQAHETLAPVAEKAGDIARFYTNAEYHASYEYQRLAHSYFGGDILPMAETDIGPGSLALYLGSEAGFARDTVWFNPCLEGIDQPIRFDPENYWWQVTRATLQACVEKSEGKYLVGCPDLVENLDILASLRGTEALMMDLIENPQQVLLRLEEINQAWSEVYTQIYDLIHLEDGSAAFGAFRLWGSGKTVKVQCDASAMLSPRMFRRFVAPNLKTQCAGLDHAMYHLDGHQCLCHLDALLEIEEIDAIEWTPDPTVPSGGNPEWYGLYRKILEHGKSVQAVGVKVDEIKPLFDQVGPQGLYLFADVPSQAEFEAIEKIVEEYR